MGNRQFKEAVFLAIVSVFFIIESYKLHNIDNLAISPALFPLIVSSLILLLSILMAFKYRETDRDERILGDKKVVLKVLALSFFYLYSMDKLGFLYSSMVYIGLFSLILGERNIVRIILFSLLFSSLIYYIFKVLFRVYLP